MGLEPDVGILGKMFNPGPQSPSSVTQGHTLIASHNPTLRPSTQRHLFLLPTAAHIQPKAAAGSSHVSCS